jgi:hypothetical protein
MKKISKGKLNLNRETLQPLQGDELEGVNGGQAITLPTTTRPTTTTTLPPPTTLSKLFPPICRTR